MIARRKVLQIALALAALPLGTGPAIADPPIKVVATFSILGDMVREVGGEGVAVSTLVGPDADAHAFQPTPSDVRVVAAADLVVVNGLGFEGWIDRLIKASGFRGPVVVATNGIVPLRAADGRKSHGHAHGAHDDDTEKSIDPHAWQSLPNGETYARNVAEGLILVDPERAVTYQANVDRYLSQIRQLDGEVRAAIAAIAPARRKAVTSHDAFGYFAAAYGIEFLSPAGVSTDAAASAKDVARLIKQIRAEHIPAVFVESISDPRLIDQIRRETGAVIGGTLFSDALSPPDGPAPTYLKMFRHNIGVLASALSS